MIRTLFTKALLLGMSLLFVTQLAAQQDHHRGQLLVQLAPQSQPEQLQKQVEATLPGAGLYTIKSISTRMNMWLLGFDADQVNEEAALLAVNQQTAVLAVQYNHNNLSLRAVPNDPDFGEQWSFLNDGTNGGNGNSDIDASSAWDITTGGTTAAGDQIVVAVIDGGADLNHEDLNFYTNPLEIGGNNLDDDNNGYIDDVSGWNAYNSTGAVQGSSHGTHVSGTVGAKGNNGIGVTGVNWDVEILPISGSSGNEATVLEAYGYALELRKRYNETNGAEGAYIVATNSSFGVDFGQPANFPLWCAFFDSLGHAGILSAGATANLSINIDQMGDVPTACSSDYMIAVTNMTSTDQINGGAAFGQNTIDLGAPGTDIFSTRPNDSYGFATGTSMATPHVAGTIALMYAAMCQGLLNSYTNDQAGLALFVKDKLLNEGVDAIGSLSNFTVSGGRLNLFKAVSSVASGNCLEITPVVVSDSCGDDCSGSIAVTPQNGTPPYAYQWDHDNANSTSAANGLCNGTYTVTITDSFNDVSIRSYTVSTPPTTQATFGQSNVSCFGANDAQLGVNTPGLTYVWSDSSTFQSLFGIGGGTYTVTVSDDGFCDTVQSFVVIEPDSFYLVEDTVLLESAPLAGDGEIQLSLFGGTLPYSFLWNDADTNEDRTNLGPALYTLTVTDDNGCTLQYQTQLLPVGIGDLIEAYSEFGIVLFPNPMGDLGAIHISGMEAGSVDLRIHDLLGREVYHSRIQGIPDNEIPLNTSGWPAGTYTVTAVQGSVVKQARLVLK